MNSMHDQVETFIQHEAYQKEPRENVKIFQLLWKQIL